MAAIAEPARPTIAWTTLEHHDEQQRLLGESWPAGPRRFCVVKAGRRAGKSMLIKRHAHMVAPSLTAADGLVVIGAPTHDDGRRIFWSDLKALAPPRLVLRTPSESRLEIELASVGGKATIRVVGLDVPERARGDAIDQLYVDEFVFLRRLAWAEVLRPSLSTAGRLGGAWLVSTPRIPRDGRPAPSAEEFRELHNMASRGTDPEWGAYAWPSKDIVPAEEIESARRQLDPRTFRQEYEATWESVEGRAYYAFEAETHGRPGLPYDPDRELIVCLDFNVSPGVAVIGQEHAYDEGTPLWRLLGPGRPLGRVVTCWIGQVWIERDSSTPAICRVLARDWGSHKGQVLVDGDATGGLAHTSQVEGPDWQLVRNYLRPTFGDRLRVVHARSNPRQGVRVASMNARLRSADGLIHMLIDSARCQRLLRDLDETQIKPGSAGEIWKPKGTMLTHMSDAIGYYIQRAHGLQRNLVFVDSL